MRGLPLHDAATAAGTGFRLVPTGADLARCGFTFPGAARTGDSAGDTAGTWSHPGPAVDSEGVPGSRAACESDKRFDAQGHGGHDAEQPARRSGRTTDLDDWT